LNTKIRLTIVNTKKHFLIVKKIKPA